MKLFEKMTILGVGLLGASLARTCRELGLTGEIMGFGRTESTLQQAKELHYIDSYSLDVKSAVEGADFIVLCCPVGSIVPVLNDFLPAVKPGCIITDVGSVKLPLVREIDSLVPDSVHFVGSHPIAGGEISGLQASSADLFKGAHVIVTPTEKTNAAALKKIMSFWKQIGMEVITMDAEEHDYIFGAVSHLPHIIAFALMNTIGEIKTKNYNDITFFSGGGLKDFTRIASGEPVMWRDICLSNQQQVLNLLNQFQETLGRIKEWIEKEDSKTLEEAIRTSNKYRLNLT